MKHIWQFSVPILILGLLAGCGPIATTPDAPIQLTQGMIDAYYALNTIDDMTSRGLLTASEADAQRSYYLDVASAEAGRDLTRGQLADVVSGNTNGWWRFISFVNIIWLFASLMIVLALIYIFAKYIFPLLRRVPVIIYEALLYAGCGGLLYAAWAYYEPSVGQFVAMPSLFGITPLVTWSYGRRVERRQKKREKKSRFEDHRPTLLLQHTLITVFYIGAAIVFESEIIGFFAVVEALIVAVLSPLPEAVGWVLRTKPSDAAEEVALLISLLLVMVYMVGEVFGLGGAYALFEVSVYYIGAYVYFAVLAVVASRYYKRERHRYWFWQIAAIVSAIAAMLAGQLLAIETLTENGGTFLLVYMLEKYIEALNWRRYWMWAMLGLGLILYGVALAINAYPGYFIFG